MPADTFTQIRYLSYENLVWGSRIKNCYSQQKEGIPIVCNEKNKHAKQLFPPENIRKI